MHAPDRTAAEARAQLLQLGALYLRRRVPRPPEALLRALPPLLRLLKEQRAALGRAGLGRAERVAATQLWVLLHDAWEAGDAGACRLLQGALEAFCLRAAPCLQAAFPGRSLELTALAGLRPACLQG